MGTMGSPCNDDWLSRDFAENSRPHMIHWLCGGWGEDVSSTISTTITKVFDPPRITSQFISFSYIAVLGEV